MHSVKPIAAFDLDGTAYKKSMLEAVFEVSIAQGLILSEDEDLVREATAAWTHHINTEDNYHYALGLMVGAFMRSMKGKTLEDLAELAANAASSGIRIRRFVREAMDLLRESHEIVIITASHYMVARQFLEASEIEIPPGLVCGSIWNLEDGCFDGKGRTIDKANTVSGLAKSGRIALFGSCAFGDTISDLGMLQMTDAGFMVNPSDTLETAGHISLHTVIESKDNLRHIPPHNENPGDYFMHQTTREILQRARVLVAA